MKFDINIITNWRFLVPSSIALLSLAFSFFNFIVGKLVASKIIQNDLKHLNKEVEEIKIEEKEYKKELKTELHNIFLAIKRIERKQVRRDSICEVRHQKDK